MRYLFNLLFLVVLTLLAVLLLPLTLMAQPADALKDIRYCGAPVRDANGVIIRNSAVPIAYQRIHPCPSTGLVKGACPGWARNHVVPLSCGGCDSVWNLMWVPTAIKSCAGKQCIDRHEREINASDPPQPDTTARVNKFPVVLP